MIGVERALEIASRSTAAGDGLAVRLDDAIETAEGWYFPWHQANLGLVDGVPLPAAGSYGVIVNKRSGQTFTLGSAFPVQRDLDFYDLGYQSASYDLVITDVNDLDATIETLSSLSLKYIELSYSAGTVWRLPKEYERDSLIEMLRNPPCIFPDVHLYFRFEELQQGLESGALKADVIGRPAKG